MMKTKLAITAVALSTLAAAPVSAADSQRLNLNALTLDGTGVASISGRTLDTNRLNRATTAPKKAEASNYGICIGNGKQRKKRRSAK